MPRNVKTRWQEVSLKNPFSSSAQRANKPRNPRAAIYEIPNSSLIMECILPWLRSPEQAILLTAPIFREKLPNCTDIFVCDVSPRTAIVTLIFQYTVCFRKTFMLLVSADYSTKFREGVKISQSFTSSRVKKFKIIRCATNMEPVPHSLF